MFSAKNYFLKRKYIISLWENYAKNPSESLKTAVCRAF